MKLSIDTKNLELLLEKKRDYIGRKVSIIGIIEAVVLLISAITEPYSNPFIPAIVIKCAVLIVAVLQIAIFIKELMKPKYEKDDLLSDIKALDIPHRTSSIIAIKNPEHPRKYLLYYDVGWKLWLFPNYSAGSEEDKPKLVRKLSEELNVNIENINLHLCATGNEEKYSTEHNEKREYYYDVYNASIDNFVHYKDDNFSLEGTQYKWMTIDEMLSIPELNENNHYVIGLVRDNT